jgi:excisionase family DNA binding protein
MAGTVPEKLAYRMGEAALAVGVSTDTLYRLVKRGELTTIKVGTRTLILREVLEAMLERAGKAA